MIQAEVHLQETIFQEVDFIPNHMLFLEKNHKLFLHNQDKV